MATIIYIADDAQTRKFKGECRGIAGLKIGAFHGLGESDTYFVELGKSIRNSAGSIDAVVFDETSIASVVGANTLMSALIHYIKTGVASSVKLVVIDPKHVINNKGRSVLNQHDIRIIADIGELGPQFRLAFDERNRTDSEKGFTYDANYTRYDANGMEDNPDDDYDDVEQSQTALADATDGQAGDDDMRIISRHTTNPFDDIENAIGDDDPFSGFDDTFGGSDDATEFSDYSDMSDGDGDAFDDGFDDDFRIIGATYSDDGEAFADDEQAVAGDDPFAGLYGTDDGNQGGATGGVDSIFGDLEQEPVDDVGLSTNLNGYSGDFDSRDIKRLLSFKEPSWDYSAINEALRNEGSGLFRGRKSGQKLGEVAPSSLANSVYIEEKQMREGAYSAPDETKIISLFSPAGGVGKAVCLDQIIPSMDMDGGTIVMKQARDIAIGDYLIGRNGEATRVLGVYPQGELDAYRVNFKDGTSVVCSGNHIWTVRKGRSDKDIDITTEEMFNAPMKFGSAKKQSYTFRVPIVGQVRLPEKQLPIPPYVLGSLIGDGCLCGHALTFSCAKRETINRLTEIIRSFYDDNHYAIVKQLPNDNNHYSWIIKYIEDDGTTNNKKNELWQQIKRYHLNVSTCDKYIPDEYLNASIKQRYQLLAGLMDTDGSASNGRLSFTTINEKLKNQFLYLVRSLGYRASVHEDRRDKYSTGVAYNIRIWTNDNLFYLSDKINTLNVYKETNTIITSNVRGDINDGQQVELPLDPYFLGTIMRSLSNSKNGTTKITVTLENGRDYQRIQQYLKQHDRYRLTEVANRANGRTVYSITCDRTTKQSERSIKNVLIAMGLYNLPKNSAFIPKIYLEASVQQRMDLLNGIMDCYGRCFSRGSHGTNPEVYCVVRGTHMRDDFVQLCESLGYKTRITQTQTSSGSYEVNILNADCAVFYGPKREKAYKLISKKQRHEFNNDYLAITSIEKLGRKEQMVCFYVDAPDHLFCVGDFILTHNTTIATMIGIQLNWYFNHDVMSGRTTSLTTRVLVLSLNEFDDIATKGIGYDSPIGQDDNKNVAELKKRIEECNGNPEWDDISQCFTASASNYVFYLPSLTLKEKLHDEIEITAEDYKMIIEVCSRFFGFIVLDMPDVMYDQKNGLVEFGLNNSDVVGVVIEPDTKNTVLLYYMLDGMKDNNNIINWDPDKSILIINKYATPDNPYLGYVKDPASYGQIKYESIVKAAANDFCYAQAMPLTEYRVTGNVLFTSDPEIKIAARDLTDKVLDVIDTNDKKNKKFVHKINQF